MPNLIKKSVTVSNRNTHHSEIFVANAKIKPSRLNDDSVAEHKASPAITGKVDNFIILVVFSPRH